MKLTLLQTDIAWRQPQENIRRARELMAREPGSDLYVLPEMWATGFDTAPQAAGETAAEALAAMQEMAAAGGCCVAGSMAVSEGGRLFNRFYMVRPDGSAVHYDKRHLFGYGGEATNFSAGRERVVTECCGVRILLQTCYDLRFPVFARNRGDYDLALYVASWPESRRTAWDTLLRARAIENQCFVAGVNRTGCDPAASYNGGSALVDAYGATLLDLGRTPAAATATLDLERLRRFREKFPVLADADRFAVEAE